MSYLIALGAAFSLLLASPVFASSDNGAWLAQVPIENLHVVVPGLIRSARPTPQGMAILARHGLRTIVDLEDDPTAIRNEASLAESEKIRFVPMAMSMHVNPDTAEVNEILGILSTPANYPLLVHCHHGENRTGLIVGLLRALVQRWAPAEAYREMLEYGFFGPKAGELDGYFELRTGWNHGPLSLRPQWLDPS